MTETHRIPTDITLHSKSRLLAVTFSDGRRFELPCEYLRVFSRAKEVRTMDQPVVGKEHVNIERIEPQGQYALKLVFDDGHDTGIYAWDTLYELGEHYDTNWPQYLARLEQLGYQRPATEGGPRRLRLLYFTYLVKKLGRDQEEVEIPPAVVNVETLLDWLRRRFGDKAYLLHPGSFRVTVNKQFSEPFTRLDHGDEVALIPSSPNAPAPE